MGTLFVNTKNKKRRSAILAKMVCDANAKINRILDFPDTLNDSERMHWAQQFFLYDYKEIYPKNSANIIGRYELPSVDEFKYKLVSSKYLLIVLGAGVLVLCVIVVCYRRRKK